MSRIAVIDCGTNTFNLRIVDFNDALVQEGGRMCLA